MATETHEQIFNKFIAAEYLNEKSVNSITLTKQEYKEYPTLKYLTLKLCI